MLQYAIKRLLLVPPTFFFISLIVFAVLNIAPGRPGAAGGGEGEDANSSAQQESYRIFKEQFNLDKPILWNFRWSLKTSEVRTLLTTASNLDGNSRAADRVSAKDDLEDFGNYLVPHLITLLQKDSNPEVRRLSAGRLTQAAQLRYVPDGEAHERVASRAENRRIGRANQEIKPWRWQESDPQERADEVTDLWTKWFETNREVFTWEGSERWHAVVFDTRFAKYWSNLINLDFGVSNADRRPVLPTLLSKIKYSLSLAVFSIMLAYLIAVPIGIFSAVRQGTRIDIGVTVVLFVFYSLPTFFSGTVYLRLFTEGDPFGWFPTGGFEASDGLARTTLSHLRDVAWHLVLPVVTFTAGALAALSRYARAGIIDVIRSDYVRTARAKGLSEPVVILKHAARNGMIPILTLLASLLPALVGGSVVIEVVFSIPGMGLYLYDAINLRDYNVVMAVRLAASLRAWLGILVSDLSYALADPRITFD
jgi:peptide/nickel transport system permease protein